MEIFSQSSVLAKLEWNFLWGNWRYFPNAVGCIDGTPHEIYRPQIEPQQDLFSGHRHYHILNTQLIVGNVGNIVFLQAGFLRSPNDAGNFNLMERIGPGTNYDMPPDVVLQADKGYGDIPPLLTPFRAAHIRRLPRHGQRVARRFKRKLSRCRIIIENTIKHIKTYQTVGSIWRHPRWFQPIVVELCTFLAQRHVLLFYDLWWLILLYGNTRDLHVSVTSNLQLKQNENLSKNWILSILHCCRQTKS